jgi:hypothetical protein
MTKRSNQGTETRLRIIAAAADLFHKQGVHATSPDDVIEASSTGKGQFYHRAGSNAYGEIERSTRPVETTVAETLSHLRRYIQSANPKPQ